VYLVHEVIAARGGEEPRELAGLAHLFEPKIHVPLIFSADVDWGGGVQRGS
jgi:hypothetical protein